jgi:hypothetical protein
MKTQTSEFETGQEAILKELRISKVNGFPFVAYTGIKDFVFMGGGKNLNGEVLHDYELLLQKIPKNPNNVQKIQIVYEYGLDTYKILVTKKGDLLPSKTIQDVYVGTLAQIIVNEMGVN